jgi:Uri superfamily endonuclease
MIMVKGIYVLVISVHKDISLNVGALGTVNFEKGLYAYVGSAQKSLEKRIGRHLRKDKRKFWHIDYLLDDDSVKVLKVFFEKVGKSEECKVANKIGERRVSTEGFGSSDCKCESHLFKIGRYQFLKESMREAVLHDREFIDAKV